MSRVSLKKRPHTTGRVHEGPRSNQRVHEGPVHENSDSECSANWIVLCTGICWQTMPQGSLVSKKSSQTYSPPTEMPTPISQPFTQVRQQNVHKTHENCACRHRVCSKATPIRHSHTNAQAHTCSRKPMSGNKMFEATHGTHDRIHPALR